MTPPPVTIVTILTIPTQYGSICIPFCKDLLARKIPTKSPVESHCWMFAIEAFATYLVLYSSYVPNKKDIENQEIDLFHGRRSEGKRRKRGKKNSNAVPSLWNYVTVN